MIVREGAQWDEERGPENTCIIRRDGKLQNDMKLERLQTMREEEGAAKQAERWRGENN
jgi:hypothetical protein